MGKNLTDILRIKAVLNFAFNSQGRQKNASSIYSGSKSPF